MCLFDTLNVILVLCQTIWESYQYIPEMVSFFFALYFLLYLANFPNCTLIICHQPTYQDIIGNSLISVGGQGRW